MSTSAHFSDAELRCKCGCGVNRCTEPLLTAAEELRAKLGKPVIVLSGFRCLKHNAAVGGAPNSLHPRGMALDIRVPGMTPAEVYEVARTIPAFGGFGHAVTFLHVDVRTTLARWTYGPDGKQRPWA